MATLKRMYEKSSTFNKIFLMKKLINIKIVDKSLVTE